MNSTVFLVAEIRASKRALARELERIVGTCAQDVGLTVVTRARAPRDHAGEANITLHVPAEAAAQQHPVWCLACRLACFCADARVSVLVLSQSAFLRRVRRERVVRTA